MERCIWTAGVNSMDVRTGKIVFHSPEFPRNEPMGSEHWYYLFVQPGYPTTLHVKIEFNFTTELENLENVEVSFAGEVAGQ